MLKLLPGVSVVAAASVNGPSPVQKVIQLLQNAKEQGIEEIHKEKVMYGKYSQFCTDTVAYKEKTIADSLSIVNEMKAKVAERVARINMLSTDIIEAEGDLANAEGDKKASTTVRDIQNKANKKVIQDYSESVDALDRALQTLRAKDQDTAQAFLQEEIPEKAQVILQAYLQQKPAAQTSKLGGVIDLLRELQLKFQDKHMEMSKTEQKSLNEYKVLLSALTKEIATLKTNIVNMQQESADANEQRADFQGTQNEKQSMADSDTEYKTNLSSECSLKGNQFKQRQQLRQEELEAIDKAVEILGAKVAGNAEKHEGNRISLVQLEADEPRKNACLNYLQKQIQKSHSTILTQVAAAVKADPFKKITTMIKTMIMKLQEEATAETTQNSFCEKALDENKHNTKEAKTKVLKLSARKDNLESKIASHSDTIELLQQEIAELNENKAEAIATRAEEKAENKQTIQEASESLEAVTEATAVLKEFYAKAEKAQSFVQQQEQPESPEIWDENYKGLQAENGGIIGMLEVIASDFARLKSETETEEESSQKKFEEFLGVTKISLATKSTQLKLNKKHLAKAKEDHGSTTADLERENKKLKNAYEQYDKLKPNCVDAGLSLAEKQARRKEEVESLKQALAILSGDIA